MPILIAVLGVLAGVAFWIMRARNVADAGRELVNVANDVRLAARRFGFRRQSNTHPVESIDGPEVAVAALGVAFLELDRLPSQEQQHALGRSLQHEFRVSLGDAGELMVLGRWLVNESNGAEQAVPRLAKRLAKIDPNGFTPLLSVVKEVATAGGGLSPHQTGALDDIRRVFRIT